MDWEDCVVDVHSVKLSKTVLETMFKKCGPVRSIIHWKGQGGEKPHIFFEYKTPGSADSARAIGLDRNDLQVIKISNNEMLKRKFRELAHGPLRERDQRCRLTGRSPQLTYAHFKRETSSSNATGKDYKLSAEPTELTSYDIGRDAWARYNAPHRDRGDTRDVYCRTSTSASVASSSSNSRERHSRHDRAFSKEYDPSRTLAASASIPSIPSIETSVSHQIIPTSNEKSLAILHIPHAGEIIKLDLDTQLEENPIGIIRILSAVKADQKLWMMTAAYYKGKHNLDSAKKVLEAGIDTAVQVGEEADTRPFWHLLGQINNIIQAKSSLITSAFTLTPMTPSAPLAENSSPGTNEVAYIHPDIHQLAKPSPTKDIPRLPATTYESSRISPATSTERDDAHSLATTVSQEHHPIPCVNRNGSPPHTRPTGLQKCEVYSIAPSPRSSTPPSGPMNPQARLYCLQNEIGSLREKQNAVLEDLSAARAGKRRAEDEVKEERSVRRKLEKHLRAMEDALARSKRMEDAALDQVKREVEARRRAEGLLADLKVRKEQSDHSVVGLGQSLFNPNSNDTAVLFHLASMIRGVSSNEHSIALPLASGGSTVSPARIGGGITIPGQSES